jgi:uncharacterized protein YndB with AHSA1/START domain
MMTAADRKPDAEVTLVRVLDAPRDLVWKVWTDPEQLAQWWGPKGFTNPVCEIDVRRGGKIRIDMHGPTGEVYPTTGIFHEIDPPSRIVFESAALDENGKVLLEGFTIVTFEEQGRKTKLTVEAISVVQGHGRRLGTKPRSSRRPGRQPDNCLKEFICERDKQKQHGRPRNCHQPSVRCTARSGLFGLDRSQAGGAMVGPTGLHHHEPRNVRDPRRGLALHHAWSGWN